MIERTISTGFLIILPPNLDLDIKKEQRLIKIIYTRFHWKYIMLIIKSISEFIFKKLNHLR